MWVVLSHFSPPFFLAGEDRSQWWVYAITAFQGVLVSGPAAVIVFFVISGLCIHHPYAAGGEFRSAQFLARRFLRIGLPLLAIVCISPLVGLEFTVFNQMAIWSLFCELIYYSLYPFLRIALRHVSWPVLFFAVFSLALAVPLSEVEQASRSTLDRTWGDYPSFGVLKNSLLGLPCWLLGLRLAEWWVKERPEELATPGAIKIWRWRLTIWALSSLALVLRFHSPFGYPWTLDFFGVACYFWLQREIVHFSKVRPSRILEWGGTWSYSIYLVHPVAQVAWGGLALTPSIAPLANWWLLMIFIAAASFAFCRVFEEPSHALAKAAARSLRTPSTVRA